MSDLAALEEYVYDEVNSVKLSFPVIYVRGGRDPMDQEAQEGWREHCTEFELVVLDTTHFFVATHANEVVSLLFKRLDAYSKGQS